MKTEKWIDLNDMQAVAIAQSEEWEIEIMTNFTAHKWWEWNKESWSKNYKYRGRPRQPKMKEVKMECFLIDGELIWRDENQSVLRHWIRQPQYDKIAVVPT